MTRQDLFVVREREQSPDTERRITLECGPDAAPHARGNLAGIPVNLVIEKIAVTLTDI